MMAINNLRGSVWAHRLLVAVLLLVMFYLYSFDLANKSSGLFCDEAAIGFNAYALGQNLRDENNVFLPLYIRSFEGFKLPTYVYLDAVIVKLFGLSVVTTRIVAVLCGVFAALFLYLIARRYFGLVVGVMAAFFLALSPGFFHMQRIAFELTTFSCFALGFVYFLSVGYEKKSWWMIVLAAVSFVLAWYSYVPARIFFITTMVFTAASFAVSPGRIRFFVKEKRLVVVAVLFLALLGTLAFVDFKSRSLLINSFHARNKSLIVRGVDTIRSDWIAIHLNARYQTAFNYLEACPRKIEIVGLLLAKYLHHYSYEFLFIQGDGHPRHIVPGKGPLPKVFALLLPLGILTCVWRFRQITYRLALIAFFCIPVGSTFVTGFNELTRVAHMYPVMALMAAIGLRTFLSFSRKVRVMQILVVGLTVGITLNSFLNYAQAYFGDYRMISDRDWYAYREDAAQFIKNNSQKYPHVYFSGLIHQIYIYFLFYGASWGDLDLVSYQKDRQYPYNLIPLREDLAMKKDLTKEYLLKKYGLNSIFLGIPDEIKMYPAIQSFSFINGDVWGEIRKIY